MATPKFRTEYRINKKGAECYRTDVYEKARDRFEQLSKNRPGVYTMQSRHVPLDRYGVALHNASGAPLWSRWY